MKQRFLKWICSWYGHEHFVDIDVEGFRKPSCHRCHTTTSWGEYYAARMRQTLNSKR
jgi:hypothetical protein